MITSITLSNFRSIGAEVEVRLRPQLTVLVGTNGVGKSNVADALRFVGDAVREGLDHALASRQGFGLVRRFSRGHPFDVRLMLDLRLGDVEWTWGVCLTSDRAQEYRVKWEFAFAHRVATQVELTNFLVPRPDAEPTLDWQRLHQALGEDSRRLGSYAVENGAWKELLRPDLVLTPPARGLVLTELAKLDARLQPLVEYLSTLTVYSLFPPILRTPQSSDPTRPMRRQGENWASHLRALDPSLSDDLLAGLGRVTGDIDRFRVSPVGGFLIPEFRHGVEGGRERWFGAAQESDGTLRMAGILTALLQSPSPSLIGIEEPELAVHPGALPLLVDYMRQAGGHTQVLVTTHSPELLDLVDPADLRVVERTEDGTQVSSLAPEQLDTIRGRLCSTSDLLRAEGLHGAPRG